MSKDPMEYMCKHYAAMSDNERCKIGIRYHFPPLKPLAYPCFGKNVEMCDKQENYSSEEIEKENKGIAMMLSMVDSGISPCCEAPLDESQVIRGGRHDGHGPRFCTKCKKWVFSV